jgi:thiamine pyrophosphokinase
MGGTQCMAYIAAQRLVSRDTGSEHEDAPTRAGGVAHSKVFIVGGIGGRLDQEFANLNVLFSFEHLPAVLVSNHCLLTLLPRGRNRIVPVRAPPPRHPTHTVRSERKLDHCSTLWHPINITF